MSEFFQSEIVREELNEINKLQEEIYGSVFSFGSLSREDQKEHIDDLIELLEKQRVMYTRLSLSDDPEAIKMRENVKTSVSMMGYPAGTDVNILFDTMKQTIDKMKDAIVD
tara:strand:+ start:158 stop:490 length:333 start_codon:yes stop_codon:yes gene_type:complete